MRNAIYFCPLRSMSPVWSPRLGFGSPTGLCSEILYLVHFPAILSLLYVPPRSQRLDLHPEFFVYHRTFSPVFGPNSPTKGHMMIPICCMHYAKLSKSMVWRTVMWPNSKYWLFVIQCGDYLMARIQRNKIYWKLEEVGHSDRNRGCSTWWNRLSACEIDIKRRILYMKGLGV